MKTLDEMIAVMQAASEGKRIECLSKVAMFKNWQPVKNPLWDWASYHYRIKPEEPKPEYVPYESAEEFLQAQKEHGLYIASDVCDNAYMLPNYLDDKGICLDEVITYPSLITYEELLRMKWQDGTPVGKLKQ